jgi:hypothetical protein
MQPLGELARRIAEVGGGLGFRTVQVGTTIEFQVYAPPDRSNAVRFGFGLGNLRYISTEVTAPVSTAAIVGGQGTGSDAFMIERVNTVEQTSWGRRETLVSRAGSSPLTELQDDGDETLADNAAKTRVAPSAADSGDQRFGVNYWLGDKVAVETAPGQQLVDIVRTVHVQAWPTSGEVVSPTVGTQSATADPVWAERLRNIDERLGRLERSVTPA